MFAAWVCLQVGHELQDVVARPFEPLKKDAIAKHQQPGDALCKIAAPGGFDDADDCCVVDAVGNTAATDQVIKPRRRVARKRFVALLIV